MKMEALAWGAKAPNLRPPSPIQLPLPESKIPR